MTPPIIRVNHDNSRIAVRYAQGKWVIVSTPTGYVVTASDADVDRWQAIHFIPEGDTE